MLRKPHLWTLITLALLMTASVFAQASSDQQSSGPETSLFQIVLLIGDKEATDSSNDVPENARAAIADISKFLPYKSYRMVDTALIRSEGESRGLMSGPDDHSYQYTLRHGRSNHGPEIHVKSFGLTDLSRTGTPTLIGTSFRVAKRETIVVGTSKLNGGNQALLVLFTAIE